MPGELIELEGEVQDLVAAVVRLSGYQFALIGGLAVMIRLGEQHRVTGDLDGVFDNPTDTPTTATLVAAGVAQDAAAIQRVVVEGTNVDIIDTFALPDDTSALPDEPKDRLFVCAHRYAFEVATPVRLAAAGRRTEVRVAPPAALVATKAHALRYASTGRRATKRSSDLYDLYRLCAVHMPTIAGDLAPAPWALRQQVAKALGDDLADLEQALAVLRAAPGIAAINPDDFADVLAELLGRLSSDAPEA